MDIVYILIYLVLQVVLAIYLNRYISSNTDFFLAGRNLPTYALAFSVFATWFGAETCIGSSGAVFSGGLSASKAEPIGYGLCLLLSAILIAPKLYNQNYTTLGDYYKERYSSLSEKLLVWIMIPSGLIWAAAQVRAFGQVISLYTDFDISMAITFATVFVIFYTLLSGMLGDIVTDVIQGGILAISLVAVLAYALGELGGLSDAFSPIPSERLSFISSNQNIFDRLDSWLIPILGSLCSQELIQRTLSAKHKQQAVKAGLSGTALYLVFGSIPIILGLLGSQLGVQVSDAEQFLPAVAKKVLPGFLYIIFIGALISAILSTIDSILLAVSALVSQNIVIPLAKITDAKQKLFVARALLVCGGVVAYVLALFGESVYSMVETASSFGTAGVLVSFVGGLYWKKGGNITAILTLVFGMVLSFSFHSIIELKSSFSLSILILSLFYFIGSLLEEKFVEKSEKSLKLSEQNI